MREEGQTYMPYLTVSAYRQLKLWK